MKRLVPFMTQSDESLTAIVFWETGSEPASGSVMAKQPMVEPEAKRVRTFLFCSSLPKRAMGSQAFELWTDMMTAVEAQA